eukprot:2268471-Rhodomonas_salina.2
MLTVSWNCRKRQMLSYTHLPHSTCVPTQTPSPTIVIFPSTNPTHPVPNPTIGVNLSAQKTHRSDPTEFFQSPWPGPGTHRFDDGDEVVVHDDDVRGVLGHVRALDAHGEAHVGLLEGGRVVGAVARNGNGLALVARLEPRHQ